MLSSRAMSVAPMPSACIALRSEEHTSELQSPMRKSDAVFCLKKKKNNKISKNMTLHNKTHMYQKKIYVRFTLALKIKVIYQLASQITGHKRKHHSNT